MVSLSMATKSVSFVWRIYDGLFVLLHLGDFFTMFRRRHSFNTLKEVEGVRVLPLEYMKLDVDICTQLLIARIRAPFLRDLLDIISVYLIRSRSMVLGLTMLAAHELPVC
jgi:hypothetical protein